MGLPQSGVGTYIIKRGAKESLAFIAAIVLYRELMKELIMLLVIMHVSMHG